MTEIEKARIFEIFEEYQNLEIENINEIYAGFLNDNILSFKNIVTFLK